MQILIGSFLGLVIAIIAWCAKSLSKSGAVAAAVIGGLVFGLGGVAWAVLLLTFFISSSLLSHAFSGKKASLSEKFAKGNQRDWGQVIANGGLGAFLAVIQVSFSDQTWPWIAFAGAMAAVNADTWSTELGVLDPSLPRLITSGREVERGTSGGISLFGSLAALGGAVIIAVFAGFFSVRMSVSWATFLVVFFSVTLGGLGGAFIDSLLGATIQAIYWCPTCLKETERSPYHSCGSRTIQKRGWLWINNDVVNFTASLSGAILTLWIWFLIV